MGYRYITLKTLYFFQTLLDMVGMKNRDTKTAHEEKVEACKEMILPFDL